MRDLSQKTLKFRPTGGNYCNILPSVLRFRRADPYSIEWWSVPCTLLVKVHTKPHELHLVYAAIYASVISTFLLCIKRVQRNGRMELWVELLVTWCRRKTTMRWRALWAIVANDVSEWLDKTTDHALTDCGSIDRHLPLLSSRLFIHSFIHCRQVLCVCTCGLWLLTPNEMWKSWSGSVAVASGI